MPAILYSIGGGDGPRCWRQRSARLSPLAADRTFRRLLRRRQQRTNLHPVGARLRAQHLVPSDGDGVRRRGEEPAARWRTRDDTGQCQRQCYEQRACTSNCIIGPNLWGHSGPLCHALSLLLSLALSLWTSILHCHSPGVVTVARRLHYSYSWLRLILVVVSTVALDLAWRYGLAGRLHKLNHKVNYNSQPSIRMKKLSSTSLADHFGGPCRAIGQACVCDVSRVSVSRQ